MKKENIFVWSHKVTFSGKYSHIIKLFRS